MSAPQPAQRVAPVAPPPQNLPLVQAIAAVLLAALALDATIDTLAALLAPFGIGRAAIRAALGLAAQSAHTPHAILAVHNIPASRAKSAPATIARSAAKADVYYRAAYVAAASGRIQRSLDKGANLRDALRAEAANFEAHRAARAKRLNAAAKTAVAAELHGPLLGWYRNWALDSDMDCRVADGHNFDAREATIIGWPGAVHPHCGCTAGPPHEGAGMVNDALGATLGYLSPASATREVLRLRRRTA